MTFDADAALRLIAESLGLVDQLGADPIAVRDVNMSDRTLVVEITVRSTDPMTVRGEIAAVMGALSGLAVPELFPVLRAESFGVQAYDEAGEELLWVVSSIESAGFAGDGRAVEWLANSVVQDNTPAYRRSQADRVIGQIETGLRGLLDHHGRQRYGSAYPNLLWSASELTKLKDRADDEGCNSNDARTLLDYVFLPQLRDAIADHHNWFDNGYVPDPQAFKELLGRLNAVRRKVAHHREISSDELKNCRTIAQNCLAPIGAVQPHLISDFLIDRWEDQAAEIVERMRVRIASTESPPAGSMPDTQRHQFAVDALTIQRNAVNEALSSLSRLVVPPIRQQIHDTAVEALTHWHAALAELVAVGSQPNLTATRAQAASDVYADGLERVCAVIQEIRWLRVNAPTE